MRIAFVVHRYGRDIVGGSETHCRMMAERLACDHAVDVLTTTASDYVTWATGYPAGIERANGVTVHRFPVAKRRNARRFADLCERVFGGAHSRADEEAWVEEDGPRAPDLIEYLRKHDSSFDVVVAFSFRYWTAYHACLALPGKVLPFPTAEADPAVRVGVLQERLLAAPAILYNCPEERRMLQEACPAPLPGGEVVGCPVDPPAPADPAAFRRAFEIDGPFALYLGRIDPNKGCDRMLELFLRYATRHSGLSLVLAGRTVLPIPDHPRVRFVGYLTEQQKHDALSAAVCLIMPSRLESLSIVLLEAWQQATPVLVNGSCDVLRGQTRRSGGGLYYETADDFVNGLACLAERPGVRDALGASGRRFVAHEYSWETVRAKVEGVLTRVAAPSRAVEVSRV